MKEKWCILNAFIGLPILIAQIVVLIWLTDAVDCIAIGIWGGCIMMATVMDLSQKLLVITIFAADLSGFALMIAYSVSAANQPSKTDSENPNDVGARMGFNIYSVSATNQPFKTDLENPNARMGFNIFFIICGILAITLNSAILLKMARSHNKLSRFSRSVSTESTPPPISSTHHSHTPSFKESSSSIFNINVPTPEQQRRNVERRTAPAPPPFVNRTISCPAIPTRSLPPTPILPFKQHIPIPQAYSSRVQSEMRIDVRPDTFALNPVLLEMEQMNKTESNDYDYEELIIACSVCFYKFNDDIRKPKWLPCDHTICLLCLMELRQSNNEFACPFCQHSFVQENVDLLPDNFMLLHQPMYYYDDNKLSDELELSLDLKSGMKSSHLPQTKVKWCLSCRTEEQFGCETSGHLSVLMPMDVVRDLERQLIQGFIMQSSKMELLNNTQEMKNEAKIEKRESIRTKSKNAETLSSKELTWCLTCETTVNYECSSFGHVSIELPIDAVRNFEQLSDIFETVQANKQAEQVNYEQPDKILQEMVPALESETELDDKAEDSDINSLDLFWCLTCDTKETPVCSSSGHMSINLPVDFVRRLVVNYLLRDEHTKEAEVTDFF